MARLLLLFLVLAAGAAHAQHPPPGGPPHGPPHGAPPPHGPHPHPHPPHGPPPEPRVIVVEVPVAAPEPPVTTPIAPLPTIDAATPTPTPTPDESVASRDESTVPARERSPSFEAAPPAPVEPRPTADATHAEAAAGVTRDTQQPPAASRWPARVVVVAAVVALLAWWFTWLRNRGLAAEAERLAQAQRELRSRHMRLREQSDALREAAVTDPLTGALTRQAFANELRDRATRLAPFRRPLSLVVFDLDHFKQINDRDGHLAGDSALRLVAGIVRECLDSDDLFGRFGGDEFLIALSDQTPSDVAALAERIRSLVEIRALAHQPSMPGLSLSMGLAHAAFAEQFDMDLLFHRADAALYRAKRNGRNRVVVADGVEDHDEAEAAQAVRHL